MPLPLPNLDDRRWVDLVEEGQALIPLYAPEDWTDHNAHDPGVTLMELFAWIAEMDIYQLNRIPDRHKLKSLALVGIAPYPPRAARTVLSFTMREGQQETLSLPADVEFEGKDPFGQSTRFRTLEPITIVPGSLQAVQVKDEEGFHNITDHWSRGESFAVFGVEPKPGAELYLGFSHALPQHKWVSFYYTFADSRAGEDERRRLLAEASERKRACRPPLSDFPCPNGKQTPTTPAEQEKIPPHHGVRLVWEILTGTRAETTWQPLQPDHMDDDTRALTLNGRVRIRPTAEMAKKALGQVGEELYYLRVRFEAGSYDAPPLLQNIAMNAAAGEQAASVRQAERIEGLDIEAVFLGVSSGAPNQRLTLPEAPVQQASFQLFTKEEEWRLWELHSDFDASGRTGRHFLLDTTNGVVTFGDGEKGRIPPQDVSVYAAYLATRAEAGNLAAGTINQLADSPHNRTALGGEFDAILEQFKAGSLSVTNPIAASGGIAAETLAHAIGRAIELTEIPKRAVTLQDHETLARKTPGVWLARVAARANRHPSFPCLKAPGLITLMILPHLPADRPLPSLGLRRVVTTYLNRRRIVGTRIEVVGPSYREVAVRARIKACTGTDKAGLRQKIIGMLDNFLHPLRGGPDGSGWPFGRDVYRSEILQVIDEVLGVDHVLSLALIAEGWDPQCGNVCLSPTELVAAGHSMKSKQCEVTMSALNRPELQRLRYWQGQTLRSRDFREQIAVEAQLRWWHNRALHNAYGIVEGFEVEQNGEGVLIRRGLAYDCFGRELILTSDMLFPRPEGPLPDAGLTLLARFRETRQFPRKDEMTAACAPNQVPTAERPELFWKRTDLVEIRDGVPLVRCKDKALMPVRLQARPLARPRIASGATISGNTNWELWSEPVGNEEMALGFQVGVDTSAAGFTEVPCYFAWLQGALWTPELKPDFFAVFLEHIATPSTTGFIFRLWMPNLSVPGNETTNQAFASRFPEFARKQKLFVCWLGIQAENEAGEHEEVDHDIP